MKCTCMELAGHAKCSDCSQIVNVGCVFMQTWECVEGLCQYGERLESANEEDEDSENEKRCSQTWGETVRLQKASRHANTY